MPRFKRAVNELRKTLGSAPGIELLAVLARRPAFGGLDSHAPYNVSATISAPLLPATDTTTYCLPSSM
jgi:hypothetical protein